MEIYTIGFTQTTAARFFGTLKRVGIRRLVDVRVSTSFNSVSPTSACTATTT